jgi:outer membrane protein assembly factor BamB
MTPVTRPIVASLVLTLVAVTARAEDWPQFRGPTGQGVSTERGLPLEWSETRNIIWKSPVPGLGWSSPAIAGGRIWLTTATSDGGGSLRALAFDVETGRQLVNVEVFRAGRTGEVNPKNSRASPTPVVDGDRVYVHFGADGTAALSTSGEIVWKATFPYVTQHGNGGSPVLYKDLLIFSCDGYDTAFVVALDKRTGKVRWQTPRRKPISQAYSTPIVIRVGDRDQVVSLGAFRVAAYDPDTGREIWAVTYGDGFSNVPTPVFDDGLVYISTGFQEPWMVAVRTDGKGDVTKSHVAWVERRGAPLTPSPVVVGDELYIVNDTGILTCLDRKTGKIGWQQRLGGNFSASPIVADGRIYFLSEEGVGTVVAPGKEFRKLATNSLNETTLASMAVSGGSIFIRSDRHLYRISAGR